MAPVLKNDSRAF